jgi:hypothetical protein
MALDLPFGVDDFLFDPFLSVQNPQRRFMDAVEHLIADCDDDHFGNRDWSD